MNAAPVPDPYLVLGVEPAATDDDLDHAFRGLVRQLHPDTRTPAEPDADADRRLQQLLTAYATLRDPISRAAYDRTHPAPATKRIQPATRPYVVQRPIRGGPAIRVGPVRWQPPTPATRPTAADAAPTTRFGWSVRFLR
jgi:hypothetical protein